MTKEINKIFSDFIIRSTECRNVYGECSVEINGTTIKDIFKLIRDTTIGPKETSPIQKDGKTYMLFGCTVKLNDALPKDFILFNPSGRVLMLK